MPNPNLTDITFILDRSGSMLSISEATEKGYAKFIEEQLNTPGECLMSLVQFNTSFETTFSGTPIKQVPKLHFQPSGGTALYDAVGFTVANISKRLSEIPEEQRPGKVVVVVMTDGEENSSREFRGPEGAKAIQTMIKHQEEKYSWNFIFLGANIDAEKAAQAIGIGAANAVQYSADVHGTEGVLRSMSKGIGRYRSAKTLGEERSLRSNFKGQALDAEDIAEINDSLLASGADPALLNKVDGAVPQTPKSK